MKAKFFTSFFFLFIIVFLFGQEFETKKDGFIYDESTMTKLTSIVDSLNMSFLMCGPNKVYYSKSQSKGSFIKVHSSDLESIKNDIRVGVSLDFLLKKYPLSELENEVLIVKHDYLDQDGVEIESYQKVAFDNSWTIEIELGKSDLNGKIEKNGLWIYAQSSVEDLNVFYLPKGLASEPIKDEYSAMLGYANCLIDTTIQKFKEDATYGYVDMPKNWRNLRDAKKQRLLDKMRGTRIMGQCSMDHRPRLHAFNMAVLSAETANWDIFLRSHLDVLKDRFDRASDGSYAWGRRKTYIKELEKLNINVPNLIVGILLRIENPAKFHYYGNVRRLGRAISETKDIDLFEQKILSMIKDEKLDVYNRVISYSLFLNYIHCTEDEALKAKRLEMLKEALEYLPKYIVDKLNRS